MGRRLGTRTEIGSATWIQVVSGNLRGFQMLRGKYITFLLSGTFTIFIQVGDDRSIAKVEL